MTTPSGSDRADRTLRVVLLLTLAGLALQATRFARIAYTVDDAWISFRIARNFLDGNGLTYEPGAPPVEGMTNLLWTLASAVWIAALPDLDPIVPARILGLVCALGAAVFAARTAVALAGPDDQRRIVASAAAAALLASNANFLYHALSGLETGLYVLALAGAAHAALVDDRGTRCAAWAAIAGWTRPEGVLLGAGLLAVGIARRGRGFAGGIVPWVAAIAVLEVFRLGYYGALVPNTFDAKPPDPVKGALYVRGWLLAGGAGLLAGAALVSGLAARLLVAGAAIFVALVAWSGGDWMAGWRRLLDVWILLLPLAAAAAALRPRLAGPVALLAIAAQLWTYQGRNAGIWTPSERLAQIGYAAGQSPGVRTVAAVDIGRLGWAFEGSILDLVGLTDAHIAALPGVHGNKEWDPEYFRARNPEIVIIALERLPNGDFRIRDYDTAVARALLQDGRYETRAALAVSDDGLLWVLTRRDVVLPEALWGPQSGPPLDALYLKEPSAEAP